MTTKLFIVEGHVQGVFFRDCTKRKACELGLVGYVKNRNDGSVESVASGQTDAVRTFESWLWQGSAGSQVVRVRSRPVSSEDWRTFEITY